MAKNSTQKPEAESRKRQREAEPPEEKLPAKRRKPSNVEKAPQFFKRPKYTSCGSKCGGKLSTAVLGPNGYLSVNTDAASNKPSGITAARKKYPQYGFKAGHLLNATFGGDGKDANNLMILTASANVKCNKFDNRVKEAIQELHGFYEKLCDKYADISQVKFGIQVEVEVEALTWGYKPPECWIHKTFFMSASTVDSVDVESLKDSNGEKLKLSDKEKKDIEGAAEKVENALASCTKMRIDNTQA
ncbi:hypothetical protein [Prosthecobacter sp.]|uniref:hypothetical protein n=1 Tax=Prosthecobacter sp. TaxID=1965333 RepID=UPI00248A6D66|nr:hypothetical protein [Prosthecobacter sp.]MDI1312052.1 hypothetical protein [Prosthecobacter sp.]